MMDLTQKQWVKHVIFHPFEGFEDMRWKKGGSLKIAFTIVALFFVAFFIGQRVGGFQFVVVSSKYFNIVPYLVQTVVFYAAWVVANWSLCTLFDGEGTLKKIAIYSAYSLVPYIVGTIVRSILSFVLIQNEYVWVNFIYLVGFWWTVVLLVMATKAVHQYSLLKTLVCMAFTVIAMVLLLLLVVLLLSLFQQVYVFFYSIYTEIYYRIRG